MHWQRAERLAERKLESLSGTHGATGTNIGHPKSATEGQWCPLSRWIDIYWDTETSTAQFFICIVSIVAILFTLLVEILFRELKQLCVRCIFKRLKIDEQSNTWRENDCNKNISCKKRSRSFIIKRRFFVCLSCLTVVCPSTCVHPLDRVEVEAEEKPDLCLIWTKTDISFVWQKLCRTSRQQNITHWFMILFLLLLFEVSLYNHNTDSGWSWGTELHLAILVSPVNQGNSFKHTWGLNIFWWTTNMLQTTSGKLMTWRWIW